jgi:hypothetical protein
MVLAQHLQHVFGLTGVFEYQAILLTLTQERNIGSDDVMLCLYWAADAQDQSACKEKPGESSHVFPDPWNSGNEGLYIPSLPDGVAQRF